MEQYTEPVVTEAVDEQKATDNCENSCDTAVSSDAPVKEACCENDEQPCCNLNEIRDLLIEQNKLSKRRSVFMLIAAVAIAAFCAFGIFTVASLIPKVNTSIDSINTAVDSINGVVQYLDVEKINAVIDDTADIAKEGVTIVEQAKTILEEVNGIDFDALNSSIRGLDATLDSISVINFETLNKAITDLQTAIEPFANFVGFFKK